MGDIPLEPALTQGGQNELCTDYPQYCVPLVGGVDRFHPINYRREFFLVQTPDLGSRSAPGVVRGMTMDRAFFIGDPTAPIHFLLFHSFTCNHCSGYHQIELIRFIQDYVLTGQATVRVAIIASGVEPYSSNAAFSAVCAGEQGAFWEMQHALFRQFSAEGPYYAYDLLQIRAIADALGLDSDVLLECVAFGRYQVILDEYYLAALDLGVSATPTMLVRRDDMGEWAKVTRNYGNLAALTRDANER
jgi:protein-disulfide isomerase